MYRRGRNLSSTMYRLTQCKMGICRINSRDASRCSVGKQVGPAVVKRQGIFSGFVTIVVLCLVILFAKLYLEG